MAEHVPPPRDPAACIDEFMRLYTQHQRRIYVYLLSLVHNVGDAEELLQETSYVLWKKFDEFGPGSNFAAWACRAAYLETLKHRRRRGQAELPLSNQFIERVAQRVSQSSDVLEQRGESFNLCMERLDEADRALIVRRYTPGASVRTLAAELARPARSVTKSLMRIRKFLMECMDRHARREDHP
jgi:RNA polymerase sigma-70 factor (ECF subfamily)